ncbi:glycosyltransferase family 4 protein [Litorihabitans aurantiacus]|uniref:D-inositol 3-phosphate glycosyltransferase n=1 Tax=Litorihabitans aurantiacus TaxID=1930061 RepID=A0AA37XF38_9MICO|nr:glycosyltransferase family 4 protein [Litorihabitans aurantiacus]GMA32218.1 glycosyl transferase family 1 [Litorihabitans aurantiacus]
MRIVHVSDCFAPRVGGIETQVGDLAAHQVAAGHEVHVLTATAGAPGDDGDAPGGAGGAGGAGGDRYRSVTTTAGGVRLHRIASRLVAGLPVHPRGSALIARRLRALAPDVVHVHAGVLSPFAFQGARSARAARLPLAITWHCMLDGVEAPLRFGARALRWDGESAALSAVSDVAAQRVAHAFPVEGAPGEVGVLPNGLDVAAWAPAGEARADDGVLRLVATQRVAPRKRTRTLVRTLAGAREVLGSGAVELSIAGDGPDVAAVRREAERLGVADAVHLLGRVPRGDLPALYARHDAFVSPARLEAFGIAALEARTSGLPVVALAGTGITSFVTDEREGLLADDDAGLVAAVVRLAREEGLRERIAAHNRAVPPAADWRDVLAAAEREYARARRLLPF